MKRVTAYEIGKSGSVSLMYYGWGTYGIVLNLYRISEKDMRQLCRALVNMEHSEAFASDIAEFLENYGSNNHTHGKQEEQP